VWWLCARGTVDTAQGAEPASIDAVPPSCAFTEPPHGVCGCLLSLRAPTGCGSITLCGRLMPRYSDSMQFDALVLAGGRSSRLGGEPKAGLVFRGSSLLQITVSAVDQARTVVVVGSDLGAVLPRPVVVVRESPPFGGPAAAIAAGLRALAQRREASSEYTLVFACDMPNAAVAVTALVDAATAAIASGRSTDGLVALDESGRTQYLAGAYRTGPLAAAVAACTRRGGVDGLSVKMLVSRLTLATVVVPAGSTADVDTWDDAERFGIARL